MNGSSDEVEGTGTPCEGWWVQEHFGRQPMQSLWLRFEAGRIVGAGSDIVGPFTFVGTIAEGGKVVMVKRYVGRHTVDYIGTYDGEGVMWGEWWIGPLHNRWLIKIKSSMAAVTDAAEVEEIAPSSSSQ